MPTPIPCFTFRFTLHIFDLRSILTSFFKSYFFRGGSRRFGEEESPKKVYKKGHARKKTPVAKKMDDNDEKNSLFGDQGHYLDDEWKEAIFTGAEKQVEVENQVEQVQDEVEEESEEEVFIIVSFS